MYPLHKLECLAFRRTSHRYLDFSSKQHSSNSGFSPWPPFYGRVISCILRKKILDNLFHLNGFTNSIEAALELLASFQSSGLWQHNCKPCRRIDQRRKKLIRGEKFWSSADKIWSRAGIFLLRRKTLNERKKLNSVWKISSLRCSLNFFISLLPLFRKCLSVQISTWWPPALQQWLKSYCFR